MPAWQRLRKCKGLRVNLERLTQKMQCSTILQQKGNV